MVDALGPVGSLDLAAKAYRLPRPFRIGVPPIPLILIQGDQIGL